MNYWYVARPNELFLDIDNATRSLKHAKARLQGAIECGKLDVAYVMQRPSRGNDHIHVIVTLAHSIYANEQRFAWEIILHSDIYRSACNIMRGSNGSGISEVADILISPFDHFGNTDYPPDGKNRPATRFRDDVCGCESKHNAATMQTCPAAIRLRGKFRNAGFFGKPSKNPCTIWPEL